MNIFAQIKTVISLQKSYFRYCDAKDTVVALFESGAIFDDFGTDVCISSSTYHKFISAANASSYEYSILLGDLLSVKRETDTKHWLYKLANKMEGKLKKEESEVSIARATMYAINWNKPLSSATIASLRADKLFTLHKNKNVLQEQGAV